MQTAIRRLQRWRTALRPGATVAELDAFEERNGLRLPRSLRTLYEHHDGIDVTEMRRPDALPFFLLPLDEVDGATSDVDDLYGPAGARRLVCWSDDNGTYVAIHLDGTFAGSLFLIDDDPPLAPAWLTVESFYDALLDAAEAQQQWWDMRRDGGTGTTSTAERPLGLVDALFAEARAADDEETRNRAARQALELSGPEHRDEVLAHLGATDMWVQEEAVNALRRWAHADSLDLFVGVVRTGTHNGRLAACVAIRTLDTPEAWTAAAALAEEFPQHRADLGQ